MRPVKIVELVARHFKISVRDLIGTRKHRHLVPARQVAAHLLRAEGLSLHAIGEILHRDHTTVMSSLAAVQVLVIQDRDFAREVEALAARTKLGRAPVSGATEDLKLALLAEADRLAKMRDRLLELVDGLYPEVTGKPSSP